MSSVCDCAVRWSEAERLKALKRIVRIESIRAVLRKTNCGARHCRRLPRWFVVWFIIALGWFSRDSYSQVFRWLKRRGTSGTPGRSTLCEARKSIGVAPLRLLAELVIQLLGRPETPKAWYAGMRLMAMDGFVLNVADTPANERAFGRPGGGRSPGAFPQVQVLSLCEIGTHILWRSLIKPCARGEVLMAVYLLRFLEENMLLLWDRGFLSYNLLRQVLDRKSQLLGRAKSHQVFKLIKRLPDGSFLAKMYRANWYRANDRHGIVVRIIEYTFNDSGRPGSGEKHRLLTTLLDARKHPAKILIELYHERWEQELTIDELKTHLCEQRSTIRSGTPAGVIQEIYGLLISHYVVRTVMVEAANTIKAPPRSLSFVNTLKILRCRFPECPRTSRGLDEWYKQLIEEIAEQILPPRRDRVNPRVIKRKMSRWPKKRQIHRHYLQPTKTFRKSIVLLN
jgi:Insertion element 4 transposase N-terminal/Transposase DDE domain